MAAIRYLTDTEKLNLLHDYETEGMKANTVCERWGISKTYLYKVKTQMWDLYLSTKDTLKSREKLATINTVVTDNARKAVTIERKAATVLERALNVMEHKLDMEEQRLGGDDSIEEKLKAETIIEFFKVAAPYFLRPLNDEGGNGDLNAKGNLVAKILNQSIKVTNNYKGNGNNVNQNPG